MTMQKLKDTPWPRIAAILVTVVLSVGGGTLGFALKVNSATAVISSKLEDTNHRLERVEAQVEKMAETRADHLGQHTELAVQMKTLDSRIQSLQRQISNMRKGNNVNGAHEPQ